MFNYQLTNIGLVNNGVFNHEVSNDAALIKGGIFKYSIINSGVISGEIKDNVVFDNCKIYNYQPLDTYGVILLPYKVIGNVCIECNQSYIQVDSTLNGVSSRLYEYGVDILEIFGVDKCYKISGDKYIEVISGDKFDIYPARYVTKKPSTKSKASQRLTLTIGEVKAEAFGKTVKNDVAPIFVNNRTMLPARFVAESLGAKVSWDGNLRKVTITKKDTCIEIFIDNEVALVNGYQRRLDSPAFIKNDRTYTPVRFIAENLGAKVSFEEGKGRVIITK